jgi:hypothetical protein
MPLFRPPSVSPPVQWFPRTAAGGIMSAFIVVIDSADMERSLIWIEGDAYGWACSNCQWRFLVPTLLSGEEAMGAYHRLAAVKFREHECGAETSPSATKQEIKREADTTFAERARMLVRRGYKPKDAVEGVLQEMEIEHGNDPRTMVKARADAQDFLLKVRKGLI